MEQANGIGEVLLRADDPEELSGWYAERLGLDTAVEGLSGEPEPGHGGRAVFTAAVTGPRGWALTIGVPDLDATVGALREAGVAVDADPDGRFAHLHDPEGNPVRLCRAGTGRARPEAPGPDTGGYLRPLDNDPADPAEPAGTARRHRWLPLVPIALAAVVAVVVTTILDSGDQPEATEQSPPATTTQAALPVAPTSSAAPGAVRVERHEPEMLGVTAGWELFAYTGLELVRIEFAEGRITRTELRAAEMSGPAQLVAGPRGVLVQPEGDTTTWYVPDGKPPRTVPAAGTSGGPALPGPEPGTLWVPVHTNGQAHLELTRLSGEPVGTSVPIPEGFWPSASDGAGTVFGQHTGGTYRAGTDGLHRVTTGAVVAAGPTHLLLVECDDRARCSRVVVDRDSGARRTLPGTTDASFGLSGVVSPDGAFAALPSSASNLTYQLIDLRSGAEHTVVELTELHSGQHPVFSPDSRWLFVPDSTGGLVAYDTREQHMRYLPVEISSVDQVAVRAGS
ncbi:putative enzyme related to lactoylglutathione lyase [Prauserella shujinwangii]|uniref:Putative enzyme related to lactoylglutathione lyase n=1 Tax=Prauserella shujinwangii TaxID=1453103 RepID=A0A2T0LTZ4_9PSEU|nr:VOC family protein [Prauserella shujinwangii]PRX47146.1 putative enzyme related to lactoylglutathione lyase [Prauserella shujinwangii]